jgi:hypothetical protein
MRREIRRHKVHDDIQLNNLSSPALPVENRSGEGSVACFDGSEPQMTVTDLSLLGNHKGWNSELVSSAAK